MFASPTRASVIVPLARLTAAATPTTDQAWATRLNSRSAPPSRYLACGPESRSGHLPLECRRQVVLEELSGRYPPYARLTLARPFRRRASARRSAGRRRVGMRDRAAERSEVPHLAVADGGGGLSQQWRVRQDSADGASLVVRGHGADDDRVAVIPHTAEIGNAAEINR